MPRFTAVLVAPLLVMFSAGSADHRVVQVHPRAVTAGFVWPVVGPVIRGFDPPDSPYGTGHRGIDIATAVGTTIVAPAAGKVTFAGPVGGNLFLTIDLGNGLEATFSWLSSLLVRNGDLVSSRQPIAQTDWGHAALSVPHLHLGFKLLDVYVDPLDYLAPPSVTSFIRLAPLAA